jgi:hypothetical protein
VFEVAGMDQAHPEPDAPAIVRASKNKKSEAIDKTEAASRRKISVKRKRRGTRGSKKTSAVEKALAKHLRPLKKHSFSEQRGEPLA